MKNSLLASAAIATLALVSAPAFAQSGPFADVPADHWAYASVDKLQRQGIVIGYPDGTYGGKRAMTRYEFAVAIARLLDKVGTPPPPPDLSGYVRREELNDFARKSDLAGLARQADVDELRRLVNEFQTELTTLGVDIDAIKKRLDALEGRVKAIEDELKRVRVSGTINTYARGNNRFRTGTNGALGAGVDTTSVRDANGFEVTGGAGSRGGILQDSRVLHDVDLNVKTQLSSVAEAEATVNYGNYLPFLNGIASIQPTRSFRSDRGAAGLYPGQKANQSEEFTVYKAQVTADLGAVRLTAGRMPMQINPYTLKLVDADYYFYNSKTDLGDIPLDGARAEFRLGPVGIMAFGAKVDPIRFVSNQNFNQQAGDRNYGLYAGAAHGAYTGFGGTGGLRSGSRLATTSTGRQYVTGNRPIGSLISPETNGAMGVEQIAGARGAFSYSKLGTLGVTYLYMSGNQTFNPLAGATGDLENRSFNRVQVLSADATIAFGGAFDAGAVYSETDTFGDSFNDLDTKSRRTEDNYALDIFGHFARGAFDITGGYRQIGPYFAAPGYWSRVGSITNIVDIEGGYGKIGYRLSNQLGLVAEVQIYNGTGDAKNNGGLSDDDRINNYRGGIKYALGSTSGLDTGVEVTEYDIANGLTGGRVKPSEFLWNLGYGYSFSQNSAVKVGYQYIQYFDRGSGFDTAQGNGGVATTQFTVKF
jgi:hypothetical protein